MASTRKEEEETKNKEEKLDYEIEPKTGVSFPVRLDGGKHLNSTGIRKKSILGFGLKIYSFGIYADNTKLKSILDLEMMSQSQTEKPMTKLYEIAINSDVWMMIRLVIVFGGLNMSLVKKNFRESIGTTLKKLTGQKNEELMNKIMGEAKDSIKLPVHSVIEITRLPGYILQTKVKGEVVSEVESELLCRAYFHLYLGEDPFDMEAKENFGRSLLYLS